MKKISNYKTDVRSMEYQVFCLNCAIKDLEEREDVYLLKVARELVVQIAKNMAKEEKQEAKE